MATEKCPNVGMALLARLGGLVVGLRMYASHTKKNVSSLRRKAVVLLCFLREIILCPGVVDTFK